MKFVPSRKRLRLGPFIVYYHWTFRAIIPLPVFTSWAFHEKNYTHNFTTGQNSLNVRGIGSERWGGRRRRRR